MIHHTKVSDAVVHISGWMRLPSGVEVTALPLVDKAQSLTEGDGSVRSLFARINYDEAFEVAAREGARLISPEELLELGSVGLQLVPYTGTPVAENDIVHSERHDRDVWRQLRERGWDGLQPVSGAGKHWLDGAPPGRSRLGGWDVDGPGPGKKLWQPVTVAHNRRHFDDGTTTMLARDARTSVVLSVGFDSALPTRPPLVDPRGPDGARRGDVWRWQMRLLSWDAKALPKFGPDGWHSVGGETEAATVAALRVHPELRRHRPDLVFETTGVVLPGPVFRQAKYYHPTRLEGPPLWLVVHTSEGLPDLVGSDSGAENLQQYALNPTRRNREGKIVPAQVSWHAAGDSDSIARSVLDEQVAFAAPGANARGLHYELCTRTGKADWADEYHTKMLSLAARQFAEWGRKFSIPIRKVGPTEMRIGTPGIAGHWDVSMGVGKGKTNHQDPGASFDWERFLRLIEGS